MFGLILVGLLISNALQMHPDWIYTFRHRHACAHRLMQAAALKEIIRERDESGSKGGVEWIEGTLKEKRRAFERGGGAGVISGQLCGVCCDITNPLIMCG